MSDGTDSPAELMVLARNHGLDVIALTDHDSVAGWDEAAAAARLHGVALVRGVEVSTRAEGVSVHVLSYLHDPAEPRFAAMLERSGTARLRRAREMVERLSQDYPIGWELVVEQASNVTAVGRPHMADALVAAGCARNRNQAFSEVLNSRSSYYVPIDVPHPTEAVAAIRAAGGVPVMAHPFAVTRGRTVSEAVIREMVDAGLAGLEADHRDHDDDARARTRALAKSLGIVVTGSSDYHGSGKINRLGENTTAREVYESLMTQGRMEVVG